MAYSLEIAELKPWEFASDCDLVGFDDAQTGETRFAHVLGNAEEVFGVVIYRRAGVPWILAATNSNMDPHDLNHTTAMDCLKLEYVFKQELAKEDRAILKATQFKASGTGPVWPQFRSVEPGYHPWFITQTEAEQLLDSLPRVIAYLRLFRQTPSLYQHDSALRVPRLPDTLPNRPLTNDDLNWDPFIPPPRPAPEPFQISEKDLALLQNLPLEHDVTTEFASSVINGASFFQEGRICLGRMTVLVESGRGLVLNGNIESAGAAPTETFGRALVQSLKKCHIRPAVIKVDNRDIQKVLQSMCDELRIRLELVADLALANEALFSYQMYVRQHG